MKAVSRQRRVMVRLRTNFPGVNNGLRQTTRGITPDPPGGVTPQRCQPEVSNLIRSVYTTSEETFGNGVSIHTRATTMPQDELGECYVAARGPRVTVSRCNLLIGT